MIQSQFNSKPAEIIFPKTDYSKMQFEGGDKLRITFLNLSPPSPARENYTL